MPRIASNVRKIPPSEGIEQAILDICNVVAYGQVDGKIRLQNALRELVRLVRAEAGR